MNNSVLLQDKHENEMHLLLHHLYDRTKNLDATITKMQKNAKKTKAQTKNEDAYFQRTNL